MKVMFDTETAIICVCCSPEKTPAEFFITTIRDFVLFAGQCCGEGLREESEFISAENSVQDTADYMAYFAIQSKCCVTSEQISGITIEGNRVFDFDRSIDISGYSIDKLQNMFVEILRASLNKLDVTIH